MSIDPTAAAQTAARELVAGRYELLAPLGEGGMGAVWRARDLRIQRDVALKYLRAGARAAQQLTREVEALARLRHPHLVSVLDAGTTEDGTSYLVMDLVPGHTLADEIARVGKLPLDRVCHIASQVARALGAAHAEGVVHRDLKPSNIMLGGVYGEPDAVKLVDFGIAQLLDGGQASLTGSQFVGTPRYASPEQARGESTSAKSDLYALGVILYEMLTGRCPFAADTALGMLYHHVYSLPPPPSRWEPALPSWLDSLVASLLLKEPHERPASAHDVLQHFRPRSTPIPRSPRLEVSVPP